MSPDCSHLFSGPPSSRSQSQDPGDTKVVKDPLQTCFRTYENTLKFEFNYITEKYFLQCMCTGCFKTTTKLDVMSQDPVCTFTPLAQISGEQPSHVKLCTYMVVHGEGQTSEWGNIFEWRGTLRSDTVRTSPFPSKASRISGTLENWICLSPEVHHMESPGGFHLEGNPEQQETACEVSRCSRTPAHPEK